MPKFNSKGEWCSGIAGGGVYWQQGVIWPDGTAGGAAWFTQDEVIAQRFDNNHARLESHNVRTTAERLLLDKPSLEVQGSSNGHWVSLVMPEAEGVHDWAERQFSNAGLGTMAPDGSYTIKDAYHSSGPWSVIEPDGERWQLTAGEATWPVGYGNRRWTYVDSDFNSYGVNIATPLPLQKPFWNFKYVEVSGQLWQLYYADRNGQGLLVFHPRGDNTGYIVTAGAAYGPDAFVISPTRVKFVWAIRAGEGFDEVRVSEIDLTKPRELLWGEPVPEPLPPLGDAIPAFERPMWQAPYHSHHTRYGDTPPDKHVGNAIYVDWDDQNPDRFAALGSPLIVNVDLVDAQKVSENLTVLWHAGAGSIADLQKKVSKGLSYFERPVSAYLDNDNWPVSDPFTNDRVWPNIQAYRFPNDTLTGFAARVEEAIERVSKYGRPMCLTTRFDDFNGTSTIEKILECMPYYEKWLRNYNIVLHMPFADRRGNGIAKNESLWQKARMFQYAIPFGRPNRFDYWKPAKASIKDVLTNKLGQSRAAVVLEPYLRKDILSNY